MASPRCPAWDDVMVGIASWHAEVRVFRTRDVTRILLDGSSKERTRAEPFNGRCHNW